MIAAEKNFTVGDQKVFAIVMSCKHWQHYLKVTQYQVTVLTDHYSLQCFMSTIALKGKQAMW